MKSLNKAIIDTLASSCPTNSDCLDKQIPNEIIKKEELFEYQRLKHQLNFDKNNNTEIVICLSDDDDDDEIEETSKINESLNENDVIILDDDVEHLTRNSRLTLKQLKDKQNFNRFLKTYYEEYVIDAKFVGNVGRWLNHSCDPNVFVQNVFVDTHDLKFPWIALFSSKTIKAGEELCCKLLFT